MPSDYCNGYLLSRIAIGEKQFTSAVYRLAILSEAEMVLQPSKVVLNRT
jgi:hypothetical protein